MITNEQLNRSPFLAACLEVAMNPFNLKIAFFSILVGGLLAACNGASNLMPGSLGSAEDSAQMPALAGMPSLPHVDATKLKCPAPYSNVPGTYVVMSAFGTLKGGTFVTSTSKFSSNTWAEVKYTRATPGPTATPKTPPPTTAEYLYYGSYTLAKHKQTGCALLSATQNGKDFPGLPSNALVANAPLTKVVNVNIKVGQLGKLTEKITGVTPTSGHGTAVLTTSKGAPFDTATITLVGRIAIK
jgi:hypothetical protein